MRKDRLVQTGVTPETEQRIRLTDAQLAAMGERLISPLTRLFNLPDKQFEDALELFPRFGGGDLRFRKALEYMRQAYRMAQKTGQEVPLQPDIRKWRARKDAQQERAEREAEETAALVDAQVTIALLKELERMGRLDLIRFTKFEQGMK